MENDLKTPAQILQAHPQVKWSPRYLGYLLMLGLCRGKKSHRSCLLSEADVLWLWAIADDIANPE